MRVKRTDIGFVSFYLLVSIQLCNFSGVLYMLGIENVLVAPLTLLLTLVVFFGLNQKIFSRSVILFLLFSFIIIVSSVLHAVFDSGLHDITLFIDYVFSLVKIFVVSFFISNLDPAQRERLLNKIFVIAFMGVFSGIASNYLKFLYVNIPPSAEYRTFGFYMNPNELGLVCAFALALVLKSNQSIILKSILSGLIFYVGFLSFSKSTILSMGLILFLFLFTTHRILSILVAALLVIFLSYPEVMVDVIFTIRETSIFELNPSQERRLDQIAAILQIGAEGASGVDDRWLIWEVALPLVMDNPILGGGLGSFHSIEGGVYHFGAWQGVHNVFLLVWGEFGILAILVFLVLLSSIGLRSIQAGYHNVFIILVIFMVTNHAFFNQSQALIMFGFLIGMADPIGSKDNRSYANRIV